MNVSYDLLPILVVQPRSKPEEEGRPLVRTREEQNRGYGSDLGEWQTCLQDCEPIALCGSKVWQEESDESRVESNVNSSNTTIENQMENPRRY